MSSRFQFSKTRLLAFKPPSAVTVYDDHPESYGLSCNVGPNGRYHTLYWRRRVAGQLTRKRLGPVGVISIDEARRSCRELAQGQLRGSLTDAHFHPGSTLTEVWSEYLEASGATKLRSWRDRIIMWDRHISPRLANAQLESITSARIEDMRAAIAGVQSNAWANRVTWMTGHLMRWAIRRGAAVPDPTVGLRQLPTVSRDRWVMPDEMPRFRCMLDAFVDLHPDVIDVIWTLLWTGQRLGNVLSMRWTHLDRTDDLWRIPRTKSGKVHTVPLVRQASKLLDARQVFSQSKWVFPAARGDGHRTQPQNAWYKVRRFGGFDDLRLHDLRHTLASWMAREGTGYPVIAAMLGHAAQGMTAKYTHIDMDSVRAATQQAVDAMEKSVDNTRSVR